MAGFTQIAQGTESELPDLNNVLELAKTEPVIEKFFLDLCGLFVVEKGTTKETKRLTKPKFTYEFSKEIIGEVYVASNRITGRTTFDKDEIYGYMKVLSDSNTQDWAQKGPRHIISDSAWRLCLELEKEDPNSEEMELPNGKVIKDNYWKTKYGILWTYNLPVNIEMLDILKRDQYKIIAELGIKDFPKNVILACESFGQDAVLRKYHNLIMLFTHASLNRSQDALTLEHEKVIHKETHTSSESEGGNRTSENTADKFKTWVRKTITGGNENG